jgi:RNA recognition motif-containing protein
MYNQDQAVNPKKLFIGNLPFSTTDAELTEAFAQFGEIVEVRVISDRFTGRSKGIAFIEFTTEEAANAAIEGMNNSTLGDRQIFVSIARPPKPREERSGGYNNDRRGGGDRGGSRGGYNNDRSGGYNRDRN